ncbi:hypothetical protein Tsp_12733, partial [Trichinella spiralis]|uniref:hypothetical protein n=1 Tax=Trichinella spiralis TaxID=6334 RepID=UPI0001EFED4C
LTIDNNIRKLEQTDRLFDMQYWLYANYPFFMRNIVHMWTDRSELYTVGAPMLWISKDVISTAL